jgi:hypothetical protein
MEKYFCYSKGVTKGVTKIEADPLSEVSSSDQQVIFLGVMQKTTDCI